MTDNPYVQPSYQPSTMSPSQERGWSVIAHVGAAIAMALSGGTLGFLGALVLYLVYKDRGPFIRHYAAATLNIQLAALIGLAVSVVLMFVFIGFLTYPLVCFWAVAMHVVAAVKANNGEWWNPPLTPRLFR